MGYMKFKHTLVKPLIFLLFVPVFIPSVHAEPYNASELLARLKQKTENIQAEYRKLRSEKQLRYLWDTQQPRNLYLSFFGANATSTEDVKFQTEAFFSSKNSNFKERLKTFFSVFTSENFLRMLFGDAVVDELVRYRFSLGSCREKCAFLWWNAESSPKVSEILAFSLRIKHVLYEEMYFDCERISTLLDTPLVFAYDARNDTLRFVGLKNMPIVNVQCVKDVNFPIYSTPNTQCVQRDN